MKTSIGISEGHRQNDKSNLHADICMDIETWSTSQDVSPKKDVQCKRM